MTGDVKAAFLVLVLDVEEDFLAAGLLSRCWEALIEEVAKFQGGPPTTESEMP